VTAQPEIFILEKIKSMKTVSSRRVARTGWRAGCSLFLVLFMSTALFGQRSNRITGSAEIVSGVDDNPFLGRSGFSTLGPQEITKAFRFYPEVRFLSEHKTSNFQFDYALGLEYYESDNPLLSTSHRATAQYETKLNQRLLLRMRDTFSRSPDFMGFMAFRGVSFTPQGILYDYAPAALRRNGFHNNAAFTLEVDTSQHSSLAITLRHSRRSFDDLPNFRTYTTQYESLNGSTEFRRKVSERTSWLAEYSVNHYQFKQYEDARNHDLMVGLEHELRPSLRISVKGGPSYTEALRAPANSTVIVIGPDGVERNVVLRPYTGYNFEFSISRSVASGNVRLFARRDNALAVGIASVSRSLTAGVDVSRDITRRFSTRFTVVGYDYMGELDNPTRHRGLSSALRLTFGLGRYSALAFGATYQIQDSNTVFYDMERRSAFVALRFFLPGSSREIIP